MVSCALKTWEQPYLLSVTSVPVSFLHRRRAFSSRSGSSLRNLKWRYSYKHMWLFYCMVKDKKNSFYFQTKNLNMKTQNLIFVLKESPYFSSRTTTSISTAMMVFKLSCSAGKRPVKWEVINCTNNHWENVIKIKVCQKL